MKVIKFKKNSCYRNYLIRLMMEEKFNNSHILYNGSYSNLIGGTTTRNNNRIVYKHFLYQGVKAEEVRRILNEIGWCKDVILIYKPNSQEKIDRIKVITWNEKRYIKNIIN